jgi:hypothetical protein
LQKKIVFGGWKRELVMGIMGGIVQLGREWLGFSGVRLSAKVTPGQSSGLGFGVWRGGELEVGEKDVWSEMD